jgi:hypothetical protein
MEQTFPGIDLKQLELDLKTAYEEKLKPDLKNLRKGIEKTKQLVEPSNIDTALLKNQKSKLINQR